MDVLVVGGGIFAVEAALELAVRGHRVTGITPGLGPDPVAESTDLNKVIRVDYGADEALTEVMEGALEGWERWNAEGPRPLYHATGVLFLAARPFEPGGFEAESHGTLTRRGHALERIGGDRLVSRYAPWSGRGYPDGYYNPRGGWAESGEVLAWRRQVASVAGVRWLDTAARAIRDPAIVETEAGPVSGEVVVVATGAWTPGLLPELGGLLTCTAHPVFHLRPHNPALYTGDRFPVFGADIAGTGWYGFPLHPSGVVKIANHGAGWPVTLNPAAGGTGAREGLSPPPRLGVATPGHEPEAPKSADRAHQVPDEELLRLRAFLRGALPGLAEDPVVGFRACVYGDSPDGDFWIDRVPGRPGVVVAAGGSGHAFKFAPKLGGWIADVVEARAAPVDGRFAWRAARAGREAARSSTPSR